MSNSFKSHQIPGPPGPAGQPGQPGSPGLVRVIIITLQCTSLEIDLSENTNLYNSVVPTVALAMMADQLAQAKMDSQVDPALLDLLAPMETQAKMEIPAMQVVLVGQVLVETVVVPAAQVKMVPMECRVVMDSQVQVVQEVNQAKLEHPDAVQGKRDLITSSQRNLNYAPSLCAFYR